MNPGGIRDDLHRNETYANEAYGELFGVQPFGRQDEADGEVATDGFLSTQRRAFRRDLAIGTPSKCWIFL